jgi:hypothetical protein
MIVRPMSLKKPSYLMPFGYLTIIVSFITDIFIFNSTFDVFSIIGMVMTSGGLFSKLIIK